MKDKVGEWAEMQREIIREWKFKGELGEPAKSRRVERKEYSMVEVEYPVVEKELREVGSLGKITKYFSYKYFNKVQSAVAGAVFGSREAVLVSAPTGSGKTDVAILGILREYIEKGEKLRVVYVAPIKALIREIEKTVRSRLPFLECVSDTSDSRVSEHRRYQVVVTTPEKMDLLTLRKKIDCSLLIIDEMHLLNEERGGVLEALVVRVRKKAGVRIIGLGGTMPNYQDLGVFIGATAANTFYFGAEYREVPIKYQVVGLRAGAEAVEVIEEVREKNTVVFLSSKEECHRLARVLGERSELVVKKKIFAYLENLCENGDFLRGYVESPENAHLLSGVGVHHSGVPYAVRKLVEDLFREGTLTLLCCTATLAWGVNLPIDTVVVSGTEVFKKDLGWTEYSLRELAQMCGRAGRKGLASCGKAVIITAHENLLACTRAAMFQFPVESRLSATLVARVLYEIKAGENTIEKLEGWLGKTFAYLRGAKHASSGRRLPEAQELVRAAVLRLAEYRAVEYQVCTGDAGRPLVVGEVGDISFWHYVDPETVGKFARVLDRIREQELDIDLGDGLLILSTAKEFGHLAAFPWEKEALQVLQKRLPYPIKSAASKMVQLITEVAPINEKISVLLQAHISGMALSSLSLEGALGAVLQNTPRLAQALFSLALPRLNRSVQALLDLIKSVTVQKWKFALPLSKAGISLSVTKHAQAYQIVVVNVLKKDILVTISSSAQYSLVFSSITAKPQLSLTLPADEGTFYQLSANYLHEFAFPALGYF